MLDEAAHGPALAQPLRLEPALIRRQGKFQPIPFVRSGEPVADHGPQHPPGLAGGGEHLGQFGQRAEPTGSGELDRAGEMSELAQVERREADQALAPTHRQDREFGLGHGVPQPGQRPVGRGVGVERRGLVGQGAPLGFERGELGEAGERRQQGFRRPLGANARLRVRLERAWHGAARLPQGYGCGVTTVIRGVYPRNRTVGTASGAGVSRRWRASAAGRRASGRRERREVGRCGAWCFSRRPPRSGPSG